VDGEQVVRPGDQVDLEHPGRLLAGAGQGAVGDQQDLFLVLLDLGPLALVDLEVLEGDLVDAELLAQGGQLLRARRDRLDPDEGACRARTAGRSAIATSSTRCPSSSARTLIMAGSW
jgi:hypothetical protein